MDYKIIIIQWDVIVLFESRLLFIGIGGCRLIRRYSII